MFCERPNKQRRVADKRKNEPIHAPGAVDHLWKLTIMVLMAVAKDDAQSCEIVYTKVHNNMLSISEHILSFAGYTDELTFLLKSRFLIELFSRKLLFG